MQGKRILFEVAHPKHFYQFRALARKLMARNDVLFIVRDKDVSLELMKKSGLPYERYGRHGKNLSSKLYFTPLILRDYFRILQTFRPDLVISRSSPYAAVMARFVGAKNVVMPDSEVVPLINNFVAPLSDIIITPANFSRDFGSKHYRVNGLFEETYLHPDSFEPDPTIRNSLDVNDGKPYFVLRFVGWNANHDVSNFGLKPDEKVILVDRLNRFGKVFITSEQDLSPDIAGHRLTTPAEKMHDVLHYAALYVGDSQTMATEAALLGTPSVRYNSFVGPDDMSNFKMLQNDYDLLRNESSFDAVINTVQELLVDGAKEEWTRKSSQYFAQKGNVNNEILSLVESFI